MDHFPIPPDIGAGGGVPAHAAPLVLTPKQAMKHFDLVKAGTRRRLILVGDIIPQRVHFVTALNYKVLCTSKLGVCELCQQCATTAGIGKSHTEHVAPCA